MTAKPRRMRRLPPSEHARAELIRLLSKGVGRDEDVVSEFVNAATRAVIQQLLEAEQADFLGGRGRYARRGWKQRGSRNGYEAIRLRTDEGTIQVQVPQVRNVGEPYRSTLVRYIDADAEVLGRIVLEAYASWLVLPGGKSVVDRVASIPSISSAAAFDVIERIASDHQAFMSRDLSEIPVDHLFGDAVFESSKRRRHDEALLVAWAIDTVGRKHILNVAVADTKSQSAWNSLLGDLLSRNMRMPRTLTTNGISGLIDAAPAVFPRAVRIGRSFHSPTERTTGIA